MGQPNVSIADGEVVHVPPSQQTCQGPVPKPGEPLVLEDRPEVEPLVQPRPDMWLKPPLEEKTPIKAKPEPHGKK